MLMQKSRPLNRMAWTNFIEHGQIQLKFKSIIILLGGLLFGYVFAFLFLLMEVFWYGKFQRNLNKIEKLPMKVNTWL